MTRRPIWARDEHRPDPGPVGGRSVDVAVVGAGITGLTAAVTLARAGCRVAVLENRTIGSGATGYTTAKISLLQSARYASLVRAHGTEVVRAYVAANQEAAAWIGERAAVDGIACDHEHRPALTWAHAREGLEELEAEAAAAQSVGLDVRVVGDTDLPFPVAGGITLDDQAQFDPLAYLHGLVRIAEGEGATIHEHTRVTGVHGAGAGSLRVDTATGELHADHVLVCTGIPMLDRSLHFARVEPVRSYLIAVPAPAGAPRSMSISVDDPVRSLRGATVDAEELLLVGGAGHTVGRRPDTDGAYRELSDWSRDVLGATEVRASWSTQDYVPQDGLPYVGSTWSLPDGVQVATGFAKWGMTNGTAAGRLMATTVLGRPPAWADAFAADRLGPSRSIGKLVQINAEVGARLVKDHLRTPAPRPQPDEGDGVVVREGRHLTAVATSGGTTCAVGGVCPHLGGVVAWNPAERSWDCPLHGSRFGADGTVLQGPAVRDLEPRPDVS